MGIEIEYLTVSNFAELMNKMLNSEIKLYNEANNFLSEAPKGFLCSDGRSTTPHYRQRIRENGNIQDHFLTEKDNALIDSLALKQFYRIVMDKSAQNIQAIKFFQNQYVADSKLAALNECRPLIRDRVARLIDKREQWMIDWMNGDFKQSQYKTEEKTLKTISGIYVRTKAEEKIADCLYIVGFPFRYEQALIIGGEIRYPDFVILHPASTPSHLILIIWEHAGMMDDTEKYEPNAMNKLRLYADNGLIVNLNMILTTETKNIKLSTDAVRLELSRIINMRNGSPVIEVEGCLEIAD